MGFEEFENRATAAISKLRKTTLKEITLVHHDDADTPVQAAL